MEIIGVGVGALITNGKNELLLLERNDNIGNSIWSIPGGKIEYGESPLITLKRELLEETGLEIEKCTFIGYLGLNPHNQQWISFVFHVSEITGQILISREEPFFKAEWFDINEIPKLDYISERTIKKFKLPKWLPE